MNLLIVTQYFWPENFRINDLVTDLVKRGHEITVLTGLPNYPGGEFAEGYSWKKGPWRQNYAGATVLRTLLLRRGSCGGVRLALNFFSFALFGSWRAWFGLRQSFDAIFVFGASPVTVGIPAIVASRRGKAPILFWVLDLWPESLTAAGGVRSPLVLGAVDRMVKWIYRRCSRVLVQSRAFIPEMARHGVPQEDIHYFPSWSEAVFQPLCQPDLEQLPLLPQGFKVLFAGNIGEAQDFSAVLAAAEILRDRTDISWLIVGDGRMAGWAKDEARGRGLERVFFLGRYPLEIMPHFYAAADALLLPLKQEPIFALTIPGKLQSYLACARPILAMLDGEGSRIVREAEAGLTCPAGDSVGLAANLLSLANMPVDARIAMGLNGRRYCEANFNQVRLFDQLESWLLEAAGESKERL